MSENDNIKLAIDLSENELHIIKTLANDANLNLDEYIRFAIYEYIIQKEGLVLFEGHVTSVSLVPEYGTYTELLPISPESLNIIKININDIIKYIESKNVSNPYQERMSKI